MIAYEVLLEKILSGSLSPGAIIQERRLTAEIGVSRTPVRDALLMLENEGLLVRREPRMLQVKHVDTQEYLENLQIRRLLEPEAARLAARNCDLATVDNLIKRVEAVREAGVPERAEVRAVDKALHELVGEGCGNGQMWRIIQGLRLQTLRFDVKNMPERFQDSCKEHLRILKALSSRDGEAARESMIEHLDNVRQSIITRLAGDPREVVQR
jgi:DNA-binding GntR family transcriptional regulator